MDEIIQKFYKAFDIEPEEQFYCVPGYCKNPPAVKQNSEKCRSCEYGVYYFQPEISLLIIMRLIVVLSYAIPDFKIKKMKGTEELKSYILECCIENLEGIYTRVRKVFELTK